MSEKSILEQALLQVQTLEEAVKANAKGILASTMKQELNDLLKEAKEEEEGDVAEQPLSDEETTDDVPDETGDEDGLDNEDSDVEPSDDEPAKDIDSLDSDDTDNMNMDDMDDMGGDFSDEDDEDVVDMTGAGEDEVLKVFKAMSPEDGIIVKKDGDNIEFSDGDDEYIIKLDDEDEELDMSNEDLSEDWNEEVSEDDFQMPTSEEEEVVYEIELDETDDVDYKDQMEEYTTEEDTNEGDSHEEEVGESARTQGFGYHGGLKSKQMFKAGNKREEINEEVSKLKKQNDEYKKALVLFKEKLNEVAVFNANLAYATRLFTEHSTTKQEKLNILKRFDSISTLKESKNLYTSLKSELDTKKPVTESVVDKLTTAPTTSSSEKVLSESKAYENPQFKRMKDLMSKIK
jgi:hypothetical protein